MNFFPSASARVVRLILFLVIGLVLKIGVVSAYGRATAPDWVSALVAKPESFNYGPAFTAVLLDEAVIDVSRDGTYTRRVRFMRRILKIDGKEEAKATVGYQADSDRIKSFQAWLVRPSGEVMVYGKKDAIDVAVHTTARELYGDAHAISISAQNDAEVGAVFAYEMVREEKSIQSQEVWSFASNVPVESSAITINLPEGWKADAQIFNHDPVVPIALGRSLTWELRQLSPVRREPLAPEMSSFAPWLAIDIRPPIGAKGVQRRAFASWADISAYYTPKYNEAAKSDAAMKAKADALVEGSADLWERIKRLGRFVQNATYISIVLNSDQGGGMIPQPATKVFQCNYGDCKDKATLLRSLLLTQGIESIPVVLHHGSLLHVRSGWPSPMQFNHVILAIKVDGSVTAPAILEHPVFGRLIIFDPTDPNTTLGWLPAGDCGGFGLFLAGDKGDLVKLPELRREDNRYDRKVSAHLHADGSIDGLIEEACFGAPAASLRDFYRNHSPTDFHKDMERWVGRTLPLARLGQLETVDGFDQASFTLKLGFASGAYGKVMRDSLLVFKPVLVARRNGFVFSKGKRSQQIVIPTYAYSEISTIELPAGYRVDELPPAVELKTAFGTYKSSFRVENDQRLIGERSVELSSAVLPASAYESVRSYYEKIIEAEQTPVVLKRN